MFVRMFFFPVFVGALLSLLSHRRHLLLSLLSLEAIMLALAISISLSSTLMVSNLCLIVVFVFAVAEARLGLAVLVAMSRLSGNDIVAA